MTENKWCLVCGLIMLAEQKTYHYNYPHDANELPRECEEHEWLSIESAMEIPLKLVKQ